MVGIFSVLVWVFVVFGSLIAFPEFFVWVIGAWFAAGTYRFWRTQNSWLMLAAVPVLVLVKWPEPTIWLGILCLVTVGQSAVLFRWRNEICSPDDSHLDRTKRGVMTKRGFIIVWLCWLLYLGHCFMGVSKNRTAEFDSNRPIVCLGDSLTDYGYPQKLQGLVSVEVKDFGFSGYTTEDGLKLIPEIVALDPQVVVVGLGGHDYKDGKSRGATKRNLKTIIEDFRMAGSEVVLIEIPRGFISDPYFGLERELAREYDLELIPDTMVRRLIFWSPIIPPGQWVSPESHNSMDGLHPNENGNRMMSRYVARSLRRVFGSSILK